jgi:hypothetical protein
MQSLITQFEALKTQFMAFEASLNNTIPPSAPDPNNIINPVEAAKAKARADIQARVEARVAEIQIAAQQKALYDLFPDNRTEMKRLRNSRYNGPWHSPAKQQLALIEQNIARIEAERAAKRRRNKGAFAQMCDQVRAANPTLSDGEVYLRARMRLKVKSNSLAALNN